jgi:hypothetical protein
MVGFARTSSGLDEILDTERAHHTSELVTATRGLELQVAKLEAALSALELHWQPSGARLSTCPIR